MEADRPGTTCSASRRARRLAFLALGLALTASAGSIYLSLGLGLKACPLCFYQRSFGMGAFAVLAVGLSVDRDRSRLHGLAALPLAVAGLGVAAFHVCLVLSGALECPPGVLGLGTAPSQSLAVFLLLSGALAAGAISTGDARRGRPLAQATGAALLGALLAWASVASSPPLPAAPAAPYDPIEQPLDMCRAPHRAAAG